jgi:hypothetical protein
MRPNGPLFVCVCSTPGAARQARPSVRTAPLCLSPGAPARSTRRRRPAAGRPMAGLQIDKITSPRRLARRAERHQPNASPTRRGGRLESSQLRLDAFGALASAPTAWPGPLKDRPVAHSLAFIAGHRREFPPKPSPGRRRRRVNVPPAANRSARPAGWQRRAIQFCLAASEQTNGGGEAAAALVAARTRRVAVPPVGGAGQMGWKPTTADDGPDKANDTRSG